VRAKATSSPRRREQVVTRQSQIRLDPQDANSLATAYRDGMTIKELARRFGIHRSTVTALLRRHGVELRPSGLAPPDIPTAASLYGQGWSVARLGERFGVDPTTVWRALRGDGVGMRPSGQRRPLG
jgi:transcriptional regulator with XRE-family HTH domain